ncbi:ribosome maturation factor RimP [Asticcacaulis machinosus]|uniref:Ribosome maturation factor RimP n=1 Tax=Asticcacaulis machinosus TaxID=2984211 RepID=A0ABT5HKS2_9CAUL|nr:ribosome maturation factor RimP [Asticcacaulis machinosus]
MRAKTTEDRKLIEIFEPIAEALGLDIVRVRLMGSNTPGGARRLQVMAERKSDGDINVNQCARLSRAISAYMDEADPITGEYILEVSSPGIDRPLTRLKDFETYEGYEARIELDRLAEGRKRFRGILAGIEDDHVAIDLEGEEETALMPFAWVVDAKLILTDELMKEGAEKAAARREAGEEDDDFDDGDDGVFANDDDDLEEFDDEAFDDDDFGDDDDDQEGTKP